MKLNLLLSALLSLSLAGTKTLQAQEKPSSVTVSGKVIDETSAPVDFSNIRLLRSKDSSLVKTGVSNQQGDYVIPGVAAGTYILSASMTGYKTVFSKSFPVAGAAVSAETLKLMPLVKNLKEVALSTQKPMIERKMDRLVLNVESSSLAAGSTAMEVLEKAPGVTVDRDDNISMRGKQGTLIMLDGKQTYMSSADVANMLRNMQSSQIESIELITSPSAKYDAAGTSGIINIRTKKNKSYGLNGTLNAGTGYGKTTKFSGGTSLNYREGKFNAFGNYSYGNNGNLSGLDLNRQVNYLDTVTDFVQLNSMERRRQSNSYKAGADYFLDKNNTLGILVNGYFNSSKELADNSTRWTNDRSQSELILVSANDKETYGNNAVNLNYKGILGKGGEELSVDADYSDYHARKDEIRGNNYTGTGIPSRAAMNVKNYAPSVISVKSVKADYAYPMKTARFEAGLKTSLVKTDNDLLLARESGTDWVPDADYTNHFIYDENIYAGYVNFSKEGKTSGIQLGLRGEHTYSKGNSLTKNQVVKRNYLELFPSISLSHKVGKDHQFGASYSRRIDRPSYDNLNPFLNFLDEYTFKKGNPFLNPEFTSSYDLSHTYRGKFNTSIGYSHTTDMMATVTEQDDETKRTYATQRNLDDQEIFSLSIYAPFTPRSWWRMNNNFQTYHISYTSTSGGDNLHTGSTVVSFNSDHSFMLGKSAGIDLSAQYQSPMQYGIFKMRAQLAFNGGIRKNFLNNKASLRMNISDIFNNRFNHLSTTYQNMNLDFTERNESRVARISLSYRFGRNEIKGARNRQTGVDDEAGRMKN